jgi:hypothetical protein
MLRALAVAFAALALAGCHDEDEITVFNQGSETVIVDLEYWDGDWWEDDHHRVVELPAGAVYTKDVGRAYEVDILIYRKSDGLILFAADYDGEDFEDDHGHVEIVVNP